MCVQFYYQLSRCGCNYVFELPSRCPYFKSKHPECEALYPQPFEPRLIITRGPVPYGLSIVRDGIRFEAHTPNPADNLNCLYRCDGKMDGSSILCPLCDVRPDLRRQIARDVARGLATDTTYFLNGCLPEKVPETGAKWQDLRRIATEATRFVSNFLLGDARKKTASPQAENPHRLPPMLSPLRLPADVAAEIEEVKEGGEEVEWALSPSVGEDETSVELPMPSPIRLPSPLLPVAETRAKVEEEVVKEALSDGFRESASDVKVPNASVDGDEQEGNLGGQGDGVTDTERPGIYIEELCSEDGEQSGVRKELSVDEDLAGATADKERMVAQALERIGAVLYG